jgi:hypothetical protein
VSRICTYCDDNGICNNPSASLAYICPEAFNDGDAICVYYTKDSPDIPCAHKKLFDILCTHKKLNEKETIQSDAVNHPGHYTQGGIECIKAIEASMTPDEFQGYCKGNVMKYIWRFREKNGLEDLKKAQVYLGWMIESKEKQEKTE